MYVDLDDTLIVRDAVNMPLVAFLFQCVNEGRRLVLLTRHAKDVQRTLARFRLTSLWDEVVRMRDDDMREGGAHPRARRDPDRRLVPRAPRRPRAARHRDLRLQHDRATGRPPPVSGPRLIRAVRMDVRAPGGDPRERRRRSARGGRRRVRAGSSARHRSAGPRRRAAVLPRRGRDRDARHRPGGGRDLHRRHLPRRTPGSRRTASTTWSAPRCSSTRCSRSPRCRAAPGPEARRPSRPDACPSTSGSTGRCPIAGGSPSTACARCSRVSRSSS